MDLPLHPVFVHLPLALSGLLPAVALAGLWLGGRRASPRRAWLAAVAGSGLLALSAWAAVATGETEEERVESFVPATALETHEDRADLFLGLAAITLAVSLVGLAPGSTGRVARWLAAGLALVVLAAGVRVGDAGAQLVYRYGAAGAYAAGQAGAAPTPEARMEADARPSERDDD